MRKKLFPGLFLSPDLRWLVILAVAAIALYTIGLGNMPLRDWDEGYYSVVARELTRTQDWMYPTRFGQPYFPKPPLGYWIGGLGYRLFGQVSEFTTRFPMAISTALGVPLLYAVVRELTSRRREAILTAGVYLTLLPVIRLGRLHMFDGFINTLLILLLFCVLRSQKNRAWALGIGLCLAGIALAKGILAVALGGIVFAFICLDRRWEVFKNPCTWIGIGLGLSVTLGWNIAQWQRYGDVFLQEHLGFHNLARISTTLEGHDGPPWYYLLEIVKYSFPWLFFCPGGLLLAWQSRDTSQGRLVLTGTILFLGMASAMGTKLPWYIMPIYPFFALAVGPQLARPLQTYAYGLRWVFAGFVLVGVGGGVYFALADRQIPLLLLAICLTVTMGWTSRQLIQRNPNFVRTLLVGTYGCWALLMMSQSWVWEINEAFLVADVGRMVAAADIPANQAVYMSFDYGRPSLEFYAEHPVVAVDIEGLKQLHQQGQYLLLNPDALEALQIQPKAVVGTADGFSLVEP